MSLFFVFLMEEAGKKNKKYVVVELVVPVKNKREPQSLSKVIELFRCLALHLHLPSHHIKSHSLETISFPLIAVRLSNSNKSVICIHGPLSPYFLFLLYRIPLGVSEMFKGLTYIYKFPQIMEAALY